MSHFDFDEFGYIDTPLKEYAPYFNDLDTYIQKTYTSLIEKYG